MSLVGRILLRTRQLASGLPSTWRVNRFRWVEGPRHQRLEIGGRTRFHVPMRSGGQGSLVIGCGNSFGFWAAPRLGTGEILLQPRSRGAIIEIGDGNMWSNNISIIANKMIRIGSHCQIGDQVAIYDCDFHEISPATRNRSEGQTASVSIGNNVWLGSRVMVLKGVVIGDNAVVAAMSVVTKSIPANCVAAGVPARIIRRHE